MLNIRVDERRMRKAMKRALERAGEKLRRESIKAWNDKNVST